MGRKKIIYLQLYIKDYTGDERLRWCSPSAWGVYSYLLCLLNISETRGALHLAKLEKHPNWKNSLTHKCIAADTTRRKLTPWASILSKQMPWQKVQILEALCELAQFKVIIIQGDALIQPRMYRDSGHHLDPKADKLDKEQTPPSSQPSNNPTKPTKPIKPTKPKKEKTSLDFQLFWDAYDKKRDRSTSERLWNALKLADQQSIMDYIPLYKEAQPEKRFRKDPVTFLRHRSWEDEIIQDQPNQKNKKQNSTILKTAQVDEQEDW